MKAASLLLVHAAQAAVLPKPRYYHVAPPKVGVPISNHEAAAVRRSQKRPDPTLDAFAGDAGAKPGTYDPWLNDPSARSKPTMKDIPRTHGAPSHRGAPRAEKEEPPSAVRPRHESAAGPSVADQFDWNSDSRPVKTSTSTKRNTTSTTTRKSSEDATNHTHHNNHTDHAHGAPTVGAGNPQETEWQSPKVKHGDATDPANYPLKEPRHHTNEGSGNSSRNHSAHHNNDTTAAHAPQNTHEDRDDHPHQSGGGHSHSDRNYNDDRRPADEGGHHHHTHGDAKSNDVDYSGWGKNRGAGPQNPCYNHGPGGVMSTGKAYQCANRTGGGGPPVNPQTGNTHYDQPHRNPPPAWNADLPIITEANAGYKSGERDATHQHRNVDASQHVYDGGTPQPRSANRQPTVGSGYAPKTDTTTKTSTSTHAAGASGHSAPAGIASASDQDHQMHHDEHASHASGNGGAPTLGAANTSPNKVAAHPHNNNMPGDDGVGGDTGHGHTDENGQRVKGDGFPDHAPAQTWPKQNSGHSNTNTKSPTNRMPGDNGDGDAPLNVDAEGHRVKGDGQSSGRTAGGKDKSGMPHCWNESDRGCSEDKSRPAASVPSKNKNPSNSAASHQNAEASQAKTASPTKAPTTSTAHAAHEHSTEAYHAPPTKDLIKEDETQWHPVPPAKKTTTSTTKKPTTTTTTSTKSATQKAYDEHLTEAASSTQYHPLAAMKYPERKSGETLPAYRGKKTEAEKGIHSR